MSEVVSQPPDGSSVAHVRAPQAYAEGYRAASEGKTRMACPYLRDDNFEGFNSWMDGYADHSERGGGEPS